MTTSPPSGSERRSSAFELLHESVQRWIWEKKWIELRDVQERAVEPIFAQRDAILAAATAAGKTEAAFLPICSRLVGDETAGVRALYVSPLKALINDQFGRLEELCKHLAIPVHRWHGDVSAGPKRALLDAPSGILLITPESLEALFVRQGTRLRHLFGEVGWVVLDELHAYVGTERGRQLQSLLHRLELAVGRTVPRVGLSATLGDMGIAAEYLRPGSGDAVEQIVAADGGQEIRMQVRAYREMDPDEEDTGDPAIAAHLFEKLRGADHLVFANSRVKVERFADLLRRLSEGKRVPNEFLPHHGSLSRELREDVEARLKDPAKPTTAICTSTLELGIDVGRVAGIAQIGAPFSVASLRQRLGRSGRRGDPAVFRGYVLEPELTDASPLLDGLRPELVQLVAMLELLIERWCEPPRDGALHLSTLIQQILALIAERGGVNADQAFGALCETGPFRSVDKKRFVRLLRNLGAHDLIVQSEDGSLLLGEAGERIVDHFGFYAVFSTPEEFRLMHQGRPLGSVALEQTLVEDLHLIFAGRCWRVVSVDVEEKLVQVEPSPGGRMPHFEGGRGGWIDEGVRMRMRQVLESASEPAYLDAEARRMLVEARANYARLGLDVERVVASGGDVLVFPWRGDRVLNTIAVQLVACGLRVMVTDPALTVLGAEVGDVRAHLGELAAAEPADPKRLAAGVKNKTAEKYDWALDEELLSVDYASRSLDTAGARDALRELAG